MRTFFWDFCRDCIDCGLFPPLGGNVAFSAFQSSSFLCNPPFPMNSLVPVAHPHPFSQSYVSLVVAILYFFALSALLSNPDSEFSFFSQPTTHTQSYTRNPTRTSREQQSHGRQSRMRQAIPHAAIPHAAIPPVGNPDNPLPAILQSCNIRYLRG